MGAQVITANRLFDGAVVYLSPQGEWVQRIEAAAVADDAVAAAALIAAGERAVQEQRVVAPYLIEVEATAQSVRPKRYREQLRASGPSIGYGVPVS
jgi:Protein of unknown function (DUF2849)